MRLLIRTPGAAIAVEGGVLVAPTGDFDIELDFHGGHVRSGLINAHDHLHRNHYGRLGNPPYADACAWARDIQRRYAPAIAAGRAMPRREALLEGAWKNLFAGVTTVVHHDAWEADFEHDFPLRVARVASADSLGMTPDLGIPPGEPRFCLHVAEGVDAAAAGQVDALDRMGLLSPRLIAVHGPGMDQSGIARFRRSGAALVWCPSSNLFLFGRTAPPGLLAEGVDVLLGSDSLLTGEGDLLDELRLARGFGHLSGSRLEAAVGAVAARRFGLAAPSLRPGAPADIVVLTRPLLEARAADVALVLVGGIPRVARPDLVPALGPLAIGGSLRTCRGVTRWTGAHAQAPAARALAFHTIGEPHR